MAYDVLEVKPMTRRIGAEVFGVPARFGRTLAQ